VNVYSDLALGEPTREEKQMVHRKNLSRCEKKETDLNNTQEEKRRDTGSRTIKRRKFRSITVGNPRFGNKGQSGEEPCRANEITLHRPQSTF